MISNWPDPESVLNEIFTGRKKELDILHDEILRPEPKTICITGPTGVGKTALALFFAERNLSSFPGGVYHFYASRSEPLESIDRQIKKYSDPYLIILDEFDGLEVQQAEDALRAIHRKHKNARLILISQQNRKLAGIDLNLHLHNFTINEYYELFLKETLITYKQKDFNQLYKLLKGHPFALSSVVDILNSEKVTLSDIVEHLRSFSYPGVFGISGEELLEDSNERKRIVSDIVTVSDEFLKKMHDDPKLLYELSPRRFEELVAEILHRLGYKVTLTPASRDKGKDIYAAKQDHLGTFLYIVECKKYSPDHPIGVALVRQLNGVVQAEQATAGILATTSFFTKGAKEFQEQINFQISLKDYFDIQKWIDAAVK